MNFSRENLVVMCFVIEIVKREIYWHQHYIRMFNDMMLVCCLTKSFLIICCVRSKRKDIYGAAYILRDRLFEYKVIFAITFYSESVESIFVCKSFLYYHRLHITSRKHFSMVFCIPCGYFSVFGHICCYQQYWLMDSTQNQLALSSALSQLSQNIQHRW